MKILLRMLSLLLMAALLVPLAACHGARSIGAFEMPDAFDTEKQYEITFWAKNDTNLTQTRIYEKAITDFEALYPNVKVHLKLYTDYGKIYNDVITNIATNTTPNVCITYPDHIATYMTGGSNTVVPLDKLMSDEKYGLGGSELRFDGPAASEMIPKFMEECKIDGVTMALPFMRSTEACYVNKTMVEALGFTLPEVLTWDFVFEVSAAAMALGKTTVTDESGKEKEVYVANGQSTFIPFIYKSTDNMMIQMLRQKAAAYSTAEGDILLFNDTTKGLLEDLAPYAASGAFCTFSIVGYPANFLNAGQCIFAVDSTAGATWMGSDAPLVDIAEDKLVQFETAVMTVPQVDPQHPTMISQGPSVCIFNKRDAGEVLASWLFTQFLLTNGVQIAYASTEGYVPVTSKAQSSAEYQDYLSREGEDNDHYYDVKLQATKLLIENTENTFVTPVFNGSASLRSAAGHLVESVTKAKRRKQTVDDAYFEKLYRDTAALYRLDAVSGEEDDQSLPAVSVGLLVTLGVIWVGMGAYVTASYVKKRKNLR
ncbi:MAG: extracellular solute-binding protein [Clostridia bacterium]|nr:extracellular solute-binding protein [Clostridia bacterium]